MTEAFAAVLRFGFEQMRLQRIWATADPENVASWRLMEHVGAILSTDRAEPTV